MNRRYSLHKVNQWDNCPFNEDEYSRFKFGDTSIAEKFGEELFNGFIIEYRELILAQTEIILLPSPSYAIPTASNFLCSSFKKYLNNFLFQNEKSVCIEAKIHRNQTYVDDYGNMDYEQRINLIANDTYYIDKHFVEGKFCIFLDDIKITGSHEHTVNKILKQYNVNGNFLFIYYAELANKDIHPNIENHFNYFAIQSTNDIISIIHNDSFRFNTRMVKYILLMDEKKFDKVVQYLKVHQKQELLDLAISNNYHQIKDYQENIQKLKIKTSWQLTYKKDKEKALMLQNSPSV